MGEFQMGSTLFSPRERTATCNAIIFLFPHKWLQLIADSCQAFRILCYLSDNVSRSYMLVGLAYIV